MKCSSIITACSKEMPVRRNCTIPQKKWEGTKQSCKFSELWDESCRLQRDKKEKKNRVQTFIALVCLYFFDLLFPLLFIPTSMSDFLSIRVLTFHNYPDLFLRSSFYLFLPLLYSNSLFYQFLSSSLLNLSVFAFSLYMIFFFFPLLFPHHTHVRMCIAQVCASTWQLACGCMLMCVSTHARCSLRKHGSSLTAACAFVLVYVSTLLESGILFNVSVEIEINRPFCLHTEKN